MTIRDTNWCDACEETCNDHGSICTTCGTSLTAPPRISTAGTGNTNNFASSTTTTTATTGIRAVPEFMTQDLIQAGRDLRNLLSGVREQVQDVNNLAQNILDQQQQQQDVWQAIPAEAMDPQASSGNRSRPTSKSVLKSIPRIVLETKSSLLHQVTIDIGTKSDNNNSVTSPLPQMQAIMGEFGNTRACSFDNSSLIVCSPITGKGGMDEKTKQAVASSSKATNIILYMQRGDGVTFVQKAIMAQQLKASAVIIGNNTNVSWPYIMKDSKGEAQSCGLNIPVVMVKQQDGQSIVQYYNKSVSGAKNANNNNSLFVCCSLHIRAATTECVVCRDAFEISQTVLRLPACGHVFHESCALAWLTKQNTCPYCRRELPTDDLDYDNERRRTQRTHAGSETGYHSNADAFYG